MTRRRRLEGAALAGLCAGLLAGLVTSARAAGDLILIDKPPEDGYTLSIGPSVIGYPEAPGSGRTKVAAIPGLDFYSSWGVFASTDIGLGVDFSRRDDLHYGLRLWPVLGRDDARSRQRGLQDIGTRIGKGGFLNYAPWEFLILQSSVLAGSGDAGDGVQVEAGATVGAPLGSRTLVGLTLGGSWANGAHLRSYYGVNAAASARGGLPVYEPSSGWKDLSLALTQETKLGERWKVSGQLLGARLLGAARNSPVTESRYETTFSLTLWHQLE
jgi:outer membrane scaffolding protein for murein synthesis (MipA/OmpV family)